ncbi:MAG: hypothetical protein ACM3PC_05350 [Deltaproteobacteria bacterium]
MKRIAVLTLVAFGCATVRVPVAPLGQPADAPGTVAPPLTELWLESSEEVPPDQARKAEAQARAAIESALAGREIPSDAAGASDAVLFVRERAVALTGARRSQQAWAKVGIVAGVVVVIAVAVVALTRGGNSQAPSAKAPKATTPVKPRGVPVSPAVRPAPSLGRAVPLRPGRVYSPSPVFVGFSVNFWIAPQPLVLAPDTAEEQWYAPPPPPPLLAEPAQGEEPPALADAPPAPDAQPEPAAPAPPMELPALLEPLTFRVEERGLFAGPVTALQLDLVDRATGRAVWSKAVSADADPLDAAAVARVLDDALAGQGWARRAR